LPSIRIPCPSYPDPHFGQLFAPEIEVEVKLINGNFQPFGFILDSGADCTMVPRSMADLTGYSLPSIPNAQVSGFSGRPMPAYTGKMTLRIQSEEFEVRCLFTKSNRTPFLLGRVDFFSRFRVQFDGLNCHITLDKIT
jgi:hypothetical protein